MLRQATYTLAFLAVLSFFVTPIAAQFNGLGIQVGAQYTFLPGIDNRLPDGVRPYGHAGQPFQSDGRMDFSGELFLVQSLRGRWELEYGIGYERRSRHFRHRYERTAPAPGPIDTSWQMRLDYLYGSVRVVYRYWTLPNGSLILSAGIKPAWLSAISSNYSATLWEDIYLAEPAFYNRFDLPLTLGTGIRIQNRLGRWEAMLFAHYSVLPFMRKDAWGFLNALHYSRQLCVGATVRYVLPY